MDVFFVFVFFFVPLGMSGPTLSNERAVPSYETVRALCWMHKI